MVRVDMKKVISSAMAMALVMSMMGCGLISEIEQDKSLEPESSAASTTRGPNSELATKTSSASVDSEALAAQSPIPLAPVPPLPPSTNFTEKQELYKPENLFLAGVNAFSYESTGIVLASTPETQNVNYSPISLWFALATAGAASEGQTEQELLEALGATDKAQLMEQGSRLFNYLSFETESGFCRLANSLWINTENTYERDFIEDAAASLYVQSFQQNFADSSAGLVMGRWVADNTGGLLAPKIKVSESQAFHIMNTVYLTEEWTTRFSEELTETDSFHTADEEVAVDFLNSEMMSGRGSVGSDFTRCSLSLKADGYDMVFVLPDEGKSLADIMGDGSRIKELFIGGEEQSGYITWKIPKFAFSTQFANMAPLLKEMGVEAAFAADSADFSALTDDKPLWLDSVIQETHILVEERGVQAAAYTDLMFAGGAPDPPRFDMILDRPFLFAIRGPNDTLLFTGAVNDPTLS